MSEEEGNYSVQSVERTAYPPFVSSPGYAPFALEPSQSRDRETLSGDGGAAGKTLIPDALIRDVRLSPNARCLYAVLKQLERNGVCQVGLTALCRQMRKGRDTVRGYIGDLEERGWIRKQLRKGPDGKFQPLEYILADSRTTLRKLAASSGERTNTEHNGAKEHTDGVEPPKETK